MHHTGEVPEFWVRIPACHSAKERHDMGKVLKDRHGIEYFEVERGTFVAAESYQDAIEQREDYGYGWSEKFLDSVGCGPLEFDRYENRPKKG